jgi:hypothetical protein
MITTRNLLIIIGLLIFTVSAASAVDTANFSRQVPSTDQLITNQTFINSSSWTTPLIFVILTIVIGIVLFIVSIILPPETPYDMIGYIAPIPLAFSCVMLGLGVDMKTAAGVGGVVLSGAAKYAVLENHTVYQPWLLLILMLVLSLLSVLNVVRILNAKSAALFSGGND